MLNSYLYTYKIPYMAQLTATAVNSGQLETVGCLHTLLMVIKSMTHYCQHVLEQRNHVKVIVGKQILWSINLFYHRHKSHQSQIINILTSPTYWHYRNITVIGAHLVWSAPPCSGQDLLCNLVKCYVNSYLVTSTPLIFLRSKSN